VKLIVVAHGDRHSRGLAGGRIQHKCIGQVEFVQDQLTGLQVAQIAGINPDLRRQWAGLDDFSRIVPASTR
jgi:hypothetical protein